MPTGISMDITDKMGDFVDKFNKAVRTEFNRVKRNRVKRAQEIAPVKTGRYKRGLSGDVKVVGDKLVMTIGGRDQKTAWIEFGTEKMRPQKVIQRSMDGIETEIEQGLAKVAQKIKVL